MNTDRLAGMLAELLDALGGLLTPGAGPEPRPIPVRAHERPTGPRR